MPRSRKLLIQQLQERFVPALIARGFQQLPLTEKDKKNRDIVSMLPLGYLKRTHGGNLDIVEIQLHPRRPAFVVGFGMAPPEGVTLPWVKLTQAEVGVSTLPESCRLYANRRSMIWFGASWLSFYKDQSSRLAQGIENAVSLLPELDDYFSGGIVGAHVKCIRHLLISSGQLTSMVRQA